MCFSLAGRVQTRLASLLAPALLASWVVWRSGDLRYLTMLVVMILVTLDLDVCLYARLFEYQSRWDTYVLSAAEFALLLLIVRVLDGTLPFFAIVTFYAVSWIGGLLIVNAVLPVLDPFWAEHGGELGRPIKVLNRARQTGSTALVYLRRYAVESTGDAVTIAALVGLTALELTIVPSSLTLLQAASAPIAAVAVSEIVRRTQVGVLITRDRALIFGLTLDLLIRSDRPWAFLVAGSLAVLSRSLLTFDTRPLFNGPICAFVAVILFMPGVYSAQNEWGNSLLLPLFITNLALFRVWQSHRLPLLAAFLSTLVIHGLFYLSLTVNPFGSWFPTFLPAYLVFFAGFVLPDPDSSPVSRPAQIAVGAAVASLGLALSARGVGIPFAVALLLCNYASAINHAAWRVRGRAATRAASSTNSSLREPRKKLSSRRTFLGVLTTTVGAALLGGSARRLLSLDPAILALAPGEALAGGRAIPRFDDVAGPAGIVLSHHGGKSEGSPAVGTGAAWGDYDSDGRLDLYVTDHGGRCHLYRNNGDGTFTDRASQAGVAQPGHRPTSAAFVDYDNDGVPDLYVGVAGGPNVLYHNNGDGTFSDVTRRSGLGDLGRTMSTAWADYDGDGYLDVFVANYPDQPVTFDGNSSPIENERMVRSIPRPQNRLFHNNGDGTFTDATELLGIWETTGFGFSAVWCDYNGDGRPDLYVAYDFGNAVQHNVLWRNDGPGGLHGWVFTPVQVAAGVAAGINAMAVASGDYNNDGWPDLVVSNIGPNLLYRNRQGATFSQVAETAGVSRSVDRIDNPLNPSITWGVDFADLNNDGWLDLYIVAGTMYFENLPQPNTLFINNHAGGFIEVSSQSGADNSGQGRSVAIADYDGDGQLDMFVANYGQPPLLYKNSSSASGHWLLIQLEGTQSNRDAVGARVVLHVPGLPPQTREVQIGQGLGSCDPTALHFGLGHADHAYRAEIVWPSGNTQTVTNISANQQLKILEPGTSRWPEKKPFHTSRV